MGVIPIPIETIEFSSEQPSLTYRLDPERRRIVGKADGLEAINQAIRKALVTPRFRCAIYDNQYGSDIKQTVQAGDTSPEFISADLPRLVEDALSQDSRILSANDFVFSFDNENAYVSFEADTVFGKTKIEVVI